MPRHKEAFEFAARLYKQAGGGNIGEAAVTEGASPTGSPAGLDHKTLLALAAGGLISSAAIPMLLGHVAGGGQEGHNAMAGLGGAMHGGLSGAIGAGGAPPGHRIEGAGRGSWIGTGAGAGGVLGGLGGAGLGALAGAHMGGTGGMAAGAIGGGLAGAGLGAYGGGKLTQHALGKPSWEEDQQ